MNCIKFLKDLHCQTSAPFSIETHNSESQEAGRMQRTSELFTGSTTVKLANAINKLP